MVKKVDDLKTFNDVIKLAKLLDWQKKKLRNLKSYLNLTITY